MKIRRSTITLAASGSLVTSLGISMWQLRLPAFVCVLAPAFYRLGRAGRGADRPVGPSKLVLGRVTGGRP